MKNKRAQILFLVAIPWLILTSMVLNAYLPIFTGRSYLLPVTARDPRDVFRGNYVALRYEFSNIELRKIAHDLKPGQSYNFGDSLYLALSESGGVLSATGLYTERRADAAVLLKVQPESRLTGSDQYANLVSGLESFFAPKTDALAWEDALRQGRVFARVSIDHSGNARLTGLEFKPKQPSDQSAEE
jgi:uncharacterized membrane-anchored protein